MTPTIDKGLDRFLVEPASRILGNTIHGLAITANESMSGLLRCNIGDTELSTKSTFESFRKVKKPGKADFVNALSDGSINRDVMRGNKFPQTNPQYVFSQLMG